MSPLYSQDNKLLVVGGKLAGGEECCCDDGACFLPDTEPCRVTFEPCAPGSIGLDGCPGELGQFCEENVLGERLCVGDGDVPIGTCEGVVMGPPVPGECQDGLSQSACEELGGTFHSGQKCG